MDSIDRTTALAIAGRNICLAEEKGLDIVTLCNGCYEVLSKANKALIEEKETREEVNKILAKTNHKLTETIEVKHFVKLLVEDIGFRKIQESVKRPYKDLKVAVHPGCHILRPHDILEFDDPDAPIFYDKIVEATGAESVYYPNRLECCTASLLALREDLALNVALEKAATIKKYADIMVTSCPFCYLQYEMSQLSSNENYDLPVVHLSQLLGLALGLEYDDLAFNENRIDASTIKEHIS
jgi:heterodisulfide reductase subunit B